MSFTWSNKKRDSRFLSKNISCLFVPNQNYRCSSRLRRNKNYHLSLFHTLHPSHTTPFSLSLPFIQSLHFSLTMVHFYFIMFISVSLRAFFLHPSLPFRAVWPDKNCQMSLKVAQSISLSSSLPLFIYFSLSYIVPILSTCLSRSPVRSFILFLFITFFCSASHPTFSHRPICSLSLFPLSPSLSIYSQFEQPLLHVQEPMLGIIIAHVRDVPVHLVTTVPNL